MSFDATEYNRLRSRRKHPVRARTEDLRRLPVYVRQERAQLVGPTDHVRPRTRGDCVNGIRPCPYVGCRHHLYLDVPRPMSVKINFPDVEPGELGGSCSLDIAERGPRTLEDVADLMNVTRERGRQLEEMALRSFARAAGKLREHLE